MERTRSWHGHVRPESREEHERFVAWLNTDEARVQYAKFLLTGYSLAQKGDNLTITMAAEEPPAIIRFLRNPRMWPEFWEYDSAGVRDESVPDEAVRVSWRRTE